MDEKDLAIQDLKKQLSIYQKLLEIAEQKLAAAIAEIPHVGRLCSYLDKYGCCTIDNRYCHRQAHTVCPDWKWKGENGEENTRHSRTD